MMGSLFISSFVLGLIFNAAPGVVFTETVRQGAKGGFHPALQIQLGSLIGDATWAILGLAGIGLFMQSAYLRWPLGLAGVIYLMYLSWDSWRQASVEFAITHEENQADTGAFSRGMTLSLTNPQNLAYWAAIGSALSAIGIDAPQTMDYVIYFAGFMSASVLWCFVCAGLVSSVLRHANAQWTRITYRLCATALLAIALSSLHELLSPLTSHISAKEKSAYAITASHPMKDS
jgi:chemosensory pili system protein ChpE